MRSAALLLSVAVLLLGCSQSTTKTETVSDTLTTRSSAEETTPGPSPPSSPLIINFPEFSTTELTDDEFDKEITAELNDLIATKNNLPFLTYQSGYSRRRIYGGDDQITETQTLTETWFFDSSHRLAAYLKSYRRDGERREAQTLVALFSNDSLIALSDWKQDDGQIGVTTHRKFVASKCPKCGIDTRRQDQTIKVDGVLSREALDNAGHELATTLSELVDQDLWANAQEGDNVFTVKKDIMDWEPAYTVEYTMSKDLFNFLKFKKLIELFKEPDAAIPKETIEVFTGVEEMASYSTKRLLQSEPSYFLLYKKFKPVGPGVDELYALSFTKDGEMMSNVLLGSSYPSSGPDGDGEEYDYAFDPKTHKLKVTSTKITWDESAQKEVRTESTTYYRMEGDGTVVIIN